MEIVSLLISLISGAAGGNLAGAALSEKNLGIIGNTIVGLVGGGLGGYILQAFGLLSHFVGNNAGVDPSTTAAVTTAASNLDLGAILANIGVGGGSGAILTALIGIIKNAMDKK